MYRPFDMTELPLLNTRPVLAISHYLLFCLEWRQQATMASSLAPDIEIGVISQDTFLDPPNRDNTLNLSPTFRTGFDEGGYVPQDS